MRIAAYLTINHSPAVLEKIYSISFTVALNQTKLLNLGMVDFGKLLSSLLRPNAHISLCGSMFTLSFSGNLPDCQIYALNWYSLN